MVSKTRSNIIIPKMDFHNSTCRICLIEKDDIAPLFDSQNKFNYSVLIKEYTGLSVEPNEQLPNVICDVCSSELMTVVSFISKCRVTNEQLQLCVDLKIPFDELHSDSVKEENLPLEIAVTIKKEEPELNSNDDFLDSNTEFEYNKPVKKKKKSKKLTINYIRMKPKKKPRSSESDMHLCKICGLIVRSKSALIVHNRKHTGERPFKCPYCDKCFSQGGTLKEHMKRRHLQDTCPIERSFTCDACGKQFIKKSDMHIHMRIHTKEKPYECSFCLQRFAQSGTLTQHKMLHTGERPYSCEICGKKFIAHTTLKRHLTVHSDEKNFKCLVCNKALKSRFALKKHILFLHTSEKPFICNDCGAGFAMKPNLKAHIKSKHSASSGYCDVCKRKYPHLAEHMRVHTGETPFQCQLCSKRFTQQRSLTGHMNRHQNATKFACAEDNCNKAFSMKCKLEYHVMKYHSNHTPHICQYCSKGYYRISDLTKHLRNNHYKKHNNAVNISTGSHISE